MSDCGSCGTCGSCDCDCFGNSGGCCDDSGAYGAPSTGEVIADVVVAALDSYEPTPTNPPRKNPEDADADEDTNTCHCTIL